MWEDNISPMEPGPSSSCLGWRLSSASGDIPYFTSVMALDPRVAPGQVDNSGSG